MGNSLFPTALFFLVPIPYPVKSVVLRWRPVLSRVQRFVNRVAWPARDSLVTIFGEYGFHCSGWCGSYRSFFSCDHSWKRPDSQSHTYSRCVFSQYNQRWCSRTHIAFCDGKYSSRVTEVSFLLYQSHISTLEWPGSPHWSDESTQVKDSSTILMHHGPISLGSLILPRIFPKERTKKCEILLASQLHSSNAWTPQSLGDRVLCKSLVGDVLLGHWNPHPITKPWSAWFCWLFSMQKAGGVLGGCATGTLEPLAYTRAFTTPH